MPVLVVIDEEEEGTEIRLLAADEVTIVPLFVLPVTEVAVFAAGSVTDAAKDVVLGTDAVTATDGIEGG